MDLRRLRVGEWVAGTSGLVLLVALFLPWYGEPAGLTPGTSPTLTGWEAFAVLDVILAVIALAAISVPIVTATHRVPAVPLAVESLTTLGGLLGLVLVVVRVLNLSGDAHGREWGLWLALAAAVGIVAGCLVAMRDERRSPAGRHTDLSGVPVSSPREIERLPAPRPEAGP
jgi:hypothetical protein